MLSPLRRGRRARDIDYIFMPQTPISKKNKAEIVEEYNKLLAKYDELKMTSKILGEPPVLDLFSKVKDYTVDNLTASIADLKTSFNSNLTEMADKLLSEAQKFSEIQQAAELAKKNLELNYHIEIAAETLQNLVSENEAKKQEFEKIAEQARRDLEEEITNKKRDWSRQQEEYNYDTKIKHKREEELYQEQKAKKETEFLERENQLKNQEMDLQNLRQQAVDAPKQLEKDLIAKEQETTKKLRSQFDQELVSVKKDWQAEKNIYELKLNNQEEQIKKQNIEIAALKQETERANKKAQELAVKVIESGAKSTAKEENKDYQKIPSN